MHHVSCLIKVGTILGFNFILCIWWNNEQRQRKGHEQLERKDHRIILPMRGVKMLYESLSRNKLLWVDHADVVLLPATAKQEWRGQSKWRSKRSSRHSCCDDMFHQNTSMLRAASIVVLKNRKFFSEKKGRVAGNVVLICQQCGRPLHLSWEIVSKKEVPKRQALKPDLTNHTIKHRESVMMIHLQLNGVFSYFNCRKIPSDEMEDWSDCDLVHAFPATSILGPI